MGDTYNIDHIGYLKGNDNEIHVNRIGYYNNSSNLSVVAEEFNNLKSYATNEYVRYASKLYKFITNHSPGAWDGSQVIETTVADVLKDKQNKLTFDATPTINSTNPVTSDGVKTALNNLSNQVNAIESSPLQAATAADMTNTNKIYVYTGNESGYTFGNWYYHNGSAWTSGGVYNSIGLNTDTSLTVAGAAADAKKVGDEIGDLKGDLNAMRNAPRLASTNLNTLKTPGVYGLHTTSTYQNAPPAEVVLGFLEVTDGIVNGSLSDVYQRATLYNGDVQVEIWGRRYSAWSDAWTSWGPVSEPTDATLSEEGKPADSKAVGDEINDLKGDLSEVNEQFIRIEHPANNIVAELIYTQGGYYSTQDALITNNNYGYTDLISCEAGKTYYVNSSASVYINFYRSDKSFIEGHGATSYVAPAETAYIRLSVNKSYQNEVRLTINAPYFNRVDSLESRYENTSYEYTLSPMICELGNPYISSGEIINAGSSNTIRTIGSILLKENTVIYPDGVSLRVIDVANVSYIANLVSTPVTITTEGQYIIAVKKLDGSNISDLNTVIEKLHIINPDSLAYIKFKSIDNVVDMLNQITTEIDEEWRNS